MLVRLVEHYMLGYFGGTLQGLRSDILVLQQLVDDRLPRLARHLVCVVYLQAPRILAVFVPTLLP